MLKNFLQTLQNFESSSRSCFFNSGCFVGSARLSSVGSSCCFCCWDWFVGSYSVVSLCLFKQICFPFVAFTTLWAMERAIIDYLKWCKTHAKTHAAISAQRGRNCNDYTLDYINYLLYYINSTSITGFVSLLVYKKVKFNK